ncbi:7137_t:CDS:2, partial [Funneliformis caledonium]
AAGLTPDLLYELIPVMLEEMEQKTSTAPTGSHSINLIQQTFKHLDSSQQIHQLQAEINRLQTRIYELEKAQQKEKIQIEQQKLAQQQKKLEKIQQFAQTENTTSNPPQILSFSPQLNELAKKLEQFDHKQTENR